MKYEITGDNLQIVTCELASGEVMQAEAGALVCMSGNMSMDTEMTGGIMGGLKRAITGESLFLTKFSPTKGAGTVSFAGNVPGKIYPYTVSKKDFIAQKDSFLCAEARITMTVTTTKGITKGLFGGEGFLLQKVSGQGTVFLHCCGDIIQKNLMPGEVLKVETGLVAGFEETVTYNIERVRGVKSILFSGQGLFMTTLTGPGLVVIQSLDIAKLAQALIPHLPRPELSSSSSGT
ncbi:MAG: TIGR00266 family protein [Methanomicrobiales archaeon]|jgi:uncharacterized protein (TIGR00266 family)|nr:TIGR00266 family protein [Methanomicrobiales archaeon]